MYNQTEKHRKEWERERHAGKMSGLSHGEPIEGWDLETMYVENLEKMQRVIAGTSPDSLVYAYWYGYREGLKQKEKSNENK